MIFYCIGDEDTVRGFRMAGVLGDIVRSHGEAAVALAKAAAQPEVGVVLLTQQFAADLRSQVEALRLKQDRPMIVEIPGPGGPLPGQKSLRQLVQEAVGIRIGE